MIVSAAVKITTLDGMEHIIPCHRHSDAFKIIKEFGIHRIKHKDVQGFMAVYITYNQDGDRMSETKFLNRNEAYIHAFLTGQVKEHKIGYELFSEDLW